MTPGMETGPWVVALGGGHGLSTTLRAVRRYAGRVTAVVSVADDGGSSGRLRQTFGIPAPGDLRRCLVALAGSDSVWARAFDHRFAAGELEGHAFGNLVIAGLAEVTGDFAVAVDEAARLLDVRGEVLPATSGPVSLKADVGGREVVGQARLSDSPGPITRVSIVPPDAPSPPEVARAIAGADQVVIGPGSLFTSVLATCVVPAVNAAINARTGGRVFVSNLRPQAGETDGYRPEDYLAALAAHGVTVDTVIQDAASSGAAPRPEGRPETHPDAPAPPRAAPPPAGLPASAPAGPSARVVTAAVAGDPAEGHDVARLSGVLASLAPTRRLLP
jgi:uncharacterized cofD-like protein